MTPEELGIALGEKMQDGYDFIYNITSKPISFDDAFAKLLEDKHNSFFSSFNSLLKQAVQLEDEAYEEYLSSAILTFTDLEDITDKESKLNEFAEQLDENIDENILNKIMSFIWLPIAYNIKELKNSEEEGPVVLGAIGY